MKYFTIIDYLLPYRLKKHEPKIKKSFEVKWSECDIDSLKTIYEASVDRVHDTVRDHNEISKKFFGLLLLILSISSALIAFLFNDEKNSFGINVIAIGAIALSFLIIVIIAQMMRPIKFRAPGRIPSTAIKPNIFKNDRIKKEDIPKIVLYQEMLNSEAAIELNQYYNTRRLNAIDLVIRVMLIGLFVLSIMLIIFQAN